MPSASTEKYVKTVYYLQDENDFVAPSAIATALDVTRPTVTKMMHDLSDRGLVVQEKYQGVHLTEDGERVALDVLRRHRLLELFLTEHLDYDWANVHEEADRLEHYISDDLTERIAEMLDEPARDPHGAPIPDANLEMGEDSGASPLSEFDEGETVVVTQVEDRNPEALNHLATVGITPGTVLEITMVASFGMIRIKPTDSGETLPLSEELAAVVRACPR